MHSDLLAAISLGGIISSVALSHDEGCTCTVCRASQGDQEAFAEVTYWMTESRKKTAGADTCSCGYCGHVHKP